MSVLLAKILFQSQTGLNVLSLVGLLGNADLSFQKQYH